MFKTVINPEQKTKINIYKKSKQNLDVYFGRGALRVNKQGLKHSTVVSETILTLLILVYVTNVELTVQS